jgi:hypothetical protein
MVLSATRNEKIDVKLSLYSTSTALFSDFQHKYSISNYSLVCRIVLHWFCFTHPACPVVERHRRGALVSALAFSEGGHERQAEDWAAVAPRAAGRNLTEKPRSCFLLVKKA